MSVIASKEGGRAGSLVAGVRRHFHDMTRDMTLLRA
jgi:hypothetical protein